MRNIFLRIDDQISKSNYVIISNCVRISSRNNLMKIKINKSTHMSMLYTGIVHPKIKMMSLITDALFQPRKT